MTLRAAREIHRNLRGALLHFSPCGAETGGESASPTLLYIGLPLAYAFALRTNY
jgi:hypothetical protein